MAVAAFDDARPSRQHLGDVEALAASMALEGLRHPVIVGPDGALIKGARRLAAAKLLGWGVIQARPVRTLEAAAAAIHDQRDETSKPRLTEEAVDLAMTVELLPRREPRPNRFSPDYDGAQVVGRALFTSGTTYKRVRAVVAASRNEHKPAHVVETARQVIVALDAGIIRINAAYDRVRFAGRVNPVDNLARDGLPAIPPPAPALRTSKARRLREDWIRALAAKGATSTQIAEQLGISQPGIKKIVKDLGLVIPADKALMRTQRKAADPERAMRVAIEDLDALVWSLDRIDLSLLDPSTAADRAAQLEEHARAIRRVSRNMKEQVR